MRFEKRGSRTVAYFFCNFQAEKTQDTEYIIGSLLRQIISKQFSPETMLVSILRAFERERTHRVSLRNLEYFLKATLAMLVNVHIVIDGLDEVSICAQKSVVSMLGLLPNKSSIHAKILMICRPQVQHHIQKIVHIEPKTDDIQRILKHRIHTDDNIIRIVEEDDAWAAKLADEVCQKSSGL
jgi:hypothetical protein